MTRCPVCDAPLRTFDDRVEHACSYPQAALRCIRVGAKVTADDGDRVRRGTVKMIHSPAGPGKGELVTVSLTNHARVFETRDVHALIRP